MSASAIERAVGYHDLPPDLRELAEEALMRHVPPERRIDLLRELFRREPACLAAALDLALLLQETGEWEEAETVYSDACRLHPDDVRPVAGLAWLLAQRDELERAELLARLAVDRGSDWTYTYMTLGRAAERRGDPETAARRFLQAFEAAPQNVAALEHHCRLVGRPFRAPIDDPPDPPALGRLARHRLYAFIDRFHRGACDHRFRATKQFCLENGLDPVEVYQFVMAHGGFCDCEVEVNVIELDADFQVVLTAGWLDAPEELPPCFHASDEAPRLDPETLEGVRTGQPCRVLAAPSGSGRLDLKPQLQDPSVLVDAVEDLQARHRGVVLILCSLDRREVIVWGRNDGGWWEAMPDGPLPLSDEDAARVRSLTAELRNTPVPSPRK